MGQGVNVEEPVWAQYVERITCPECNSVVDYLTFLEPGNTPPWARLFPMTARPEICPACGAALGVSGHGVNLVERITPTSVTCLVCRNPLILFVSEIADHNVEQYCPVCGTMAC